MRQLVTFAAVMLVVALLAPVSQAQAQGGTIANAPQSTDPAHGSHTGHAGVTPVPMGVSPRPAPAFPAPTPIGVPPMLPAPGTNNTAGAGSYHHRHHRDVFVGGAYPVYMPVPVVVDPYAMYQASPDQEDQETEDPPVVPGPTVFERRTPSEVTATRDPAPSPSTQEPAAPAPDASAAQSEPANSQPAQPQELTVLVFRDGHQLEVQNYAIVGDFLYDFTPGHARKVPLSQLDLPATEKANADRGLDFTLPASAKGSP